MLHQFLGWGLGVEGVPSCQAYQGWVADDPLVRRAPIALVNGQNAGGVHDDDGRWSVSLCRKFVARICCMQ
jgi:hypothetical protein